MVMFEVLSLIFSYYNRPDQVINPFVLNTPFFYPPLKTENMVFCCFQGVEKGCIGSKWADKAGLGFMLNSVLVHLSQPNSLKFYEIYCARVSYENHLSCEQYITQLVV